MANSESERLGGRIIVLCFLYPPALIASLNGLFHLGIEWTLLNWLAAIGLGMCVNFISTE